MHKQETDNNDNEVDGDDDHDDDGDSGDESYDDEGHIHWFNRWKIIEKNLDIWRELGPAGRKNYYQKSFEKLKHNQHVFYTRDFTDETLNLFYD